MTLSTNTKLAVAVGAIAVAGIAGVRGLSIGRDPTPADQRTNLTGATVLLVEDNTGHGLDQTAVDVLAATPGIAEVEPFLLLDRRPHPILGVRPGAALRVRVAQESLVATVTAGEPITAADARQPVVLAGASVVAEDYRPQADMAAMLHALQPGRSIQLPTGERLRVAGIFTTGSPDLDRLLIVPLACQWPSCSPRLWP